MLKLEISASVLLTIAVSLLTLGTSFLKDSMTTEGCVCIVVGFGLIIATIVMLSEGIIKGLKKA